MCMKRTENIKKILCLIKKMKENLTHTWKNTHASTFHKWFTCQLPYSNSIYIFKHPKNNQKEEKKKETTKGNKHITQKRE